MRKRRYFTGAECEYMWDRWQAARQTIAVIDEITTKNRVRVIDLPWLIVVSSLYPHP